MLLTLVKLIFPRRCSQIEDATETFSCVCFGTLFCRTLRVRVYRSV